MSKASKLVTDALLGEDSASVVVNGKIYDIPSPTIQRIAMAAKYLNNVEGGENMDDAIGMMKNLEDSCRALSVFIQGDEALTDELVKGTPNDIVGGLKVAWSLISIKDFQMLSALARNVARLIAKPRPSGTTR